MGAGPFSTEQANETGRTLGECGHEFGTVAGGQRRCGWFDAVMVRQAVRIVGIDGTPLTKFDVWMDRRCSMSASGIGREGESFDYFPPGQTAGASSTAEYEELDGWRGSIRIPFAGGPPATAVKYVRRIEELIRLPVALLSTSPEREDTILVRAPFAE